MCESVFKNQDEEKRREDFTRLFVSLVSNTAAQQIMALKPAKTVKKEEKAM